MYSSQLLCIASLPITILIYYGGLVCNQWTNINTLSLTKVHSLHAGSSFELYSYMSFDTNMHIRGFPILSHLTE